MTLNPAFGLPFNLTTRFFFSKKKTGLVDYVSPEGSSAFDRALLLAEKISDNAPLALRAAKLAISRALDLPLESGKTRLLIYRNSYLMASSRSGFRTSIIRAPTPFERPHGSFTSIQREASSHLVRRIECINIGNTTMDGMQSWMNRNEESIMQVHF